MKMLMRCAAVASLVVATTASAAEPQTPQAFMQHLYQRFMLGPDAATVDWARGQAGEAFDPALATLIRRYAAAADKAQSAAFDYVPFCGCNDDSGLKYAIAAKPEKGGAATADVTVTGSGRFAGKPTVLTYDLVRTPMGWRIVDIHSKATPSLKMQVVRALRNDYHLSAR